MKRILLIFPIALIAIQFSSCGNATSDIEDINWLIGKWHGVDVNELVFNESWEREGKNSFTGFGCIITPDGDTVFKETLKINLVEGNLYYVATVPENKGPVLFKMVSGGKQNAVFENREHDFPQRISYLLENNNHMSVKLEGVEKGIPKTEKLQFERVTGLPLIRCIKTDSMIVDSLPTEIKINF